MNWGGTAPYKQWISSWGIWGKRQFYKALEEATWETELDWLGGWDFLTRLKWVSQSRLGGLWLVVCGFLASGAFPVSTGSGDLGWAAEAALMWGCQYIVYFHLYCAILTGTGLREPPKWQCLLLLLRGHQVVSHSFLTPSIVTRQAPLSMGFPKQKYWSRSPFPPPGHLPTQGLNQCLPSPALQVDSLPTELSGKPWDRLMSGNYIYFKPCKIYFWPSHR